MHEEFMRRAIALSRAAAIGFDDARLYRELAMPRDERTLPMIRLLPADALEVFREWISDPERVPY